MITCSTLIPQPDTIVLNLGRVLFKNLHNPSQCIGLMIIKQRIIIIFNTMLLLRNKAPTIMNWLYTIIQFEPTKRFSFVFITKMFLINILLFNNHKACYPGRNSIQEEHLTRHRIFTRFPHTSQKQ